MDWSHFGLTRRPFRPAVDTASYFPAVPHTAALGAVAAAFDRRDPIALVDGPPGAGKSLVARRWLERLPPAVPRVVLPNGHGTRVADLLQGILFDLDQPYQGLAEQELRLAVTARLLAAAADGHPTVLLVDEAQHLTAAALEEIRLLGNIEAGGGAVLFALLVAQPTLRDALRRPAYEVIAQRVAVRAEVGPLSPDEAVGYLRHQVRAAGGDPSRVFERDALAVLAASCDGLPRVLNQAAALAAELAAAGGAGVVDVEAVVEALVRLDREAVDPAEAAPAEESALPARADGADEAGDAAADEGRAGRTPKVKPARKRSA